MERVERISEHIYWMKPGPPDRPSLCAVTGTGGTLMLDAAASDAHARAFLDALIGAGIPGPHLVALTHWHWDHVFGTAEVGAPVIGHQETAARLIWLAGLDWSDAALDQRVATGQEIAFCADNIKLELPEPRQVRIAPVEIVFAERLDIRLGDVSCQICHVGGDHASDSCVVFVQPDAVVFLGDCLYEAIYAPERHYTKERLFPLLDAILSFDARLYIEGHNAEMMPRSETERLARIMRTVGTLADEHGSAVLALREATEEALGRPLDTDAEDVVRAFAAGKALK